VGAIHWTVRLDDRYVYQSVGGTVPISSMTRNIMELGQSDTSERSGRTLPFEQQVELKHPELHKCDNALPINSDKTSNCPILETRYDIQYDFGQSVNQKLILTQRPTLWPRP
jgi:hypothetical protein